MQLHRPIPEYEWVTSLSSFPVNCLFARDLAQFWYLQGLGGVAGDTDGSAGYLRDFLKGRRFKRVAAFGASAGGYAALLFGSLLGVDEIHAFMPMTRLPSRKLVELARSLPMRNWSLVRRQIQLRLTRTLDRRYWDLRRVLREDNGRTVYHLYYGRGYGPDRFHAERVNDLPRVVLHPFDYNRHYLIDHLKRSGELTPILRATYSRLLDSKHVECRA